jgi:hypothetical protein
MDARWYQIAALSALLGYGVGWLDFDVGLAQIVVTLASVLVAQFVGTRLAKLPAFEPRSALISGCRFVFYCAPIPSRSPRRRACSQSRASSSSDSTTSISSIRRTSPSWP